MVDRTKTWIVKNENLIRIFLRVQANAKKNAIQLDGTELETGRLKVRINAPPRDGAANKELIEFFSETLGVAKSKITLSRGQGSREKDLLVYGIDLQGALNRINSLA